METPKELTVWMMADGSVVQIGLRTLGAVCYNQTQLPNCILGHFGTELRPEVVTSV